MHRPCIGKWTVQVRYRDGATAEKLKSGLKEGPNKVKRNSERSYGRLGQMWWLIASVSDVKSHHIPLQKLILFHIFCNRTDRSLLYPTFKSTFRNRDKFGRFTCAHRTDKSGIFILILKAFQQEQQTINFTM